MKPETLKLLFPNASKSTLEANTDPNGSASSPDAKRGLRDGTLAAPKAKDRHSGKRAVRITSFRVRKCDVEGLCGKWHLDALRYAGLIHDDTEDDITYQISQRKVDTKAQEKTLIEIE